jgi:S-methylmethionine-dependent homocysteine/selenocysteine methylase
MTGNAYDSIQQRLSRREQVVLDGAIGSEIVRRGVRWRQHGMRTDPDVVRAVHEDYVTAGADVITTNTFQLTRRTYLNLFQNVEHMRHIGSETLEQRAAQLLQAAVNRAREAREKVAGHRPVAIAGSITTLEWCFRPDLAPRLEQARAEYLEIVRVMAESGVDLILFETFNGAAEAKVALAAAAELHVPAWIGFVCDCQGKLFSGETLAQAVEILEPLGPDVILLNCAPPDDISIGLRELTAHCSRPTGTFAHIGRFDPPEWLFTDEYPPAKYLECARRWVDLGARVIGGCCGTTPDHIQALKQGLP